MTGKYWINCARCGAEITADHVYEPGEIFTCEGCGTDWTMDRLFMEKLDLMGFILPTGDGFIVFEFGHSIQEDQDEH